MSTHATISLVNTDGSVESVYLHFDGNVNRAGKTLFERYSDELVRKALISQGHLRALGPTIEICMAYRDVGGSPYNTCLSVFASEEDYYKRIDRELCTCEYNYIFKGKSWYVWRRGMPLACAMKLNRNSSDEEFEEGVDMVRGLVRV